MRNVLKYSLLCLIVSFLMLSISSQAQALGDEPGSDFVSFYTVGANFSAVEKNTFAWDETPFIYMELAEDFGFGDDYVTYFAEGSEDLHFATVIGSGMTSHDFPTDVWFELDSWDVSKEAGLWFVDAEVFDTFTETDSFGSTSFTVTPEPLSMTLFLIGGGPIALNLHRRKKRALKI